MGFNKNTSFISSAGLIPQRRLPGGMRVVTLRSVQCALVRLAEGGLIERHGVTDPRYSLNYKTIFGQPVKSALLENIDRPNKHCPCF